MRIMELTKSVQQHRKIEYIAAQKLVKRLSSEYLNTHPLVRDK